MIKLNRKSIVAFILAVFCSTAWAQVDVEMFGLGRGVLTNNNLNGNILEGDSLTENKGLSGYNLFDLGFNFTKGREFRSNMILRVRQPWGEFWGEETEFEFRQLQIVGDLKRVRYELGDVDIRMTPYTVYNNEEMYHQYESAVFSDRRDIVNYENFIADNVWRLQGVKLGTIMYTEKIIDQVRIDGFGVRTKISDDISIPDRIMAGLTAEVLKDEKFTASVNYVGLLDIPLDDFATNYRNHVITGKGEYFIINNEGLKLNVFAEGGFSDMDFYRLAEDSTFKANDFFVDGGVGLTIKNGIAFKLSYKNVGANFNSPAAQTRRINVAETPLLFEQVLDNTIDRSQILFDRFTQENIYNRAISPVLGAFIPYYNNVTPYGEATPNRTGVTLDVSEDQSEKIKFSLKGRYLTELEGEGTTEKRNFIAVLGGVELGINSMIGFDRELSFTLGGKYEKTDRGDGSVDLSSTMLDAGIAFGIVEELDLLIGAKVLMAEGDEVIAVRNDLNDITSFNGITVDLMESIYAFGIRVNFNETTNFIVNYNIVAHQNDLTKSMSYSINQLFMNFNIMF